MNARFDHVMQALKLLADPSTALGARLRTDARAESRLSAPMIEWALRTTIQALPDHLQSLNTNAPRVYVDHAALVLSGNVFTAPAEPLAIHAITGVHTRVKTASADGSFARAFVDALELVSPELRARFELHTFERNDHQSALRLLSNVDVVTAYGSDETMQALRAIAPPHAHFIENGHGFGAIFLDAMSLENKGDVELARRVALDVSTYDQRGCRSPQIIFVAAPLERAGAFARALSRAFTDIEHVLPRGSLDASELAQEAMWRQSMRAIGTLHESATASVALIEASAPISSPLHRNIQVMQIDAFEPFEHFLRAAGSQLTMLGLDGAIDQRWFERLESVNPARWATIVDIGEMQTTPLDASELIYGLMR